MARELSPWGRQVKIEQIKRGWSNQQLAEEAHLSKTYVNAVVYGRVISPKAVRIISDALGIEPPESFADSVS